MNMHISTPEDTFLLTTPNAVIGKKINAKEAMQLAYRLAFAGLGHVSPNPLVGCVITDNENNLLGTGAHTCYGGEHAEAVAIKQVLARFSSAKLRDATMHVTLQPCDHHGKTPPCTTLLQRYRFRKVYYGMPDPNPLVGKASALLAKDGIICEQNTIPDLQWLDEVYFWHHQDKIYSHVQDKQIYVAAKIASSLDGSFAYKNKGRKWLTSERARQYGHFLRQRYDAIIIGRKTLELDNPTLNVRLAMKTARNPLKIIFANPDFLQGTYHALTHEADKTFFVVAAKTSVQTPDVQVLSVPTNSRGQFVLQQLLQILRQKLSIHSVLLEGGGVLWQSFFQAGLVDKLHLFQAGQLLGGDKFFHRWQGTEGKTQLHALRLLPLDGDWQIEGRLS